MNEREQETTIGKPLGNAENQRGTRRKASNRNAFLIAVATAGRVFRDLSLRSTISDERHRTSAISGYRVLTRRDSLSFAGEVR